MAIEHETCYRSTDCCTRLPNKLLHFCKLAIQRNVFVECTERGLFSFKITVF